MARKLAMLFSGGVVFCLGIYLWNQTDQAFVAFIVSLLGLAIAVSSVFFKPQTSRRTIEVYGSMRRSYIELKRSEEKHPTDDKLTVGKDMEDSIFSDKS